MKKIPILFVIFCCCCTLSCKPAPESTHTEKTQSETETSKQRPNIILIMADDLGFGDVGYNGSEIRTPTIDNLAKSGARFDRYYTYAICSPTRAALMTGHHAFETGVDGPIGLDKGLPMEFKLLPEFLQEAGYQTAIVGKWHLGAAETKYFPQNRGFESFYGILHGFTDHYTHITPRGELDWQRNGKSIREEGHSTELFTDEAIKVIENRNSEKPLFLFLSYTAPHSPLQAPDSITATYENIKHPLRREFAAMVEQMDMGIGRVLGAVAKQGLTDNTLVIFVSDNGGNPRAGASNGSLQQGKGSALEGGIRVPAIATWPSTINANTVIHRPASVHEWMPTLLHIAGIDVNASDWYGENIYPTLSGQEQLPTPFVVGARRPGNFRQAAVIDWPWKLVDLGTTNEISGSRLFNIEDDPTESHDRKLEHPELTARLMEKLESTPEGPSITEKEAATFTQRGDPLRFLKGYTEEKLPPAAEAAIAE